MPNYLLDIPVDLNDNELFPEKGSFVNCQHEKVSEDFQGRLYRVIGQKTYPITSMQKFNRIIAIACLVVTLGIAYFSSTIKEMLHPKNITFYIEEMEKKEIPNFKDTEPLYLPDELWLKIMDFADTRAILRLGETGKHCSNLTNDQSFWHKRCSPSILGLEHSKNSLKRDYENIVEHPIPIIAYKILDFYTPKLDLVYTPKFNAVKFKNSLPNQREMNPENLDLKELYRERENLSALAYSPVADGYWMLISKNNMSFNTTLRFSPPYISSLTYYKTLKYFQNQPDTTYAVSRSTRSDVWGNKKIAVRVNGPSWEQISFETHDKVASNASTPVSMIF